MVKNICNVRRKLKAQNIGGLSPLQHIFRLVKERGYMHYRRNVEDTTMLGDLVFTLSF